MFEGAKFANPNFGTGTGRYGVHSVSCLFVMFVGGGARPAHGVRLRRRVVFDHLSNSGPSGIRYCFSVNFQYAYPYAD